VRGVTQVQSQLKCEYESASSDVRVRVYALVCTAAHASSDARTCVHEKRFLPEDARVSGWVHVVGWMDGWMDGCTREWMVGWVDESHSSVGKIRLWGVTLICTHRPTPRSHCLFADSQRLDALVVQLAEGLCAGCHIRAPVLNLVKGRDPRATLRCIPE
jgi:hypothetical protein